MGKKEKSVGYNMYLLMRKMEEKGKKKTPHNYN